MCAQACLRKHWGTSFSDGDWPAGNRLQQREVCHSVALFPYSMTLALRSTLWLPSTSQSLSYHNSLYFHPSRISSQDWRDDSLDKILNREVWEPRLRSSEPIWNWDGHGPPTTPSLSRASWPAGVATTGKFQHSARDIVPMNKNHNERLLLDPSLTYISTYIHMYSLYM